MNRFVGYLILSLLSFILFGKTTACAQGTSPIDQLETWLKNKPTSDLSDLAWASQPLTKAQAIEAADVMWADYVTQIKQDRKKEWDSKLLQLDDLKMKFDYKTFGKPGKDGRRFFISMHGGGGAPPRVNEQQWRNQIGLYQPEEGLYLAPRAPTNTWNLWHQGHIDRFFERLIQDAVVFEGVDPNRVYLMGYSAGGDGVYQLAPRMADHLAAAAMMAGHPNDANPLGLRNIGFTLHMGAEDSAYNRNKIAADWKIKLADLKKSDPEGYPHEVIIHEGKGHWMDREDAVAVDWMSNFTRNPWPEKIAWHIRNSAPQEFYWLRADKPQAKTDVIVSRQGQNIDIEKCGAGEIVIRLNDEMVDLDKPVVIKNSNGEVETQNCQRNIKTLYKTLQERGDRSYMFPAEISVANPKP